MRQEKRMFGHYIKTNFLGIRNHVGARCAIPAPKKLYVSFKQMSLGPKMFSDQEKISCYSEKNIFFLAAIFIFLLKYCFLLLFFPVRNNYFLFQEKNILRQEKIVLSPYQEKCSHHQISLF